jgi:hypothetical protein
MKINVIHKKLFLALLSFGSKYTDYLQIVFSINGKELSKESSLYSIMQNFCVNANVYICSLI